MSMRRFWVIAIIFGIICSTGCGAEGIRRPEGACIGIIETSGSYDDGRMIILNQSFRQLGELPIRHASLAWPVVYNNELYMIPQGHFNLDEETIVLSINLTSFDRTTYDLGVHRLQSLCVDENNIYARDFLNVVRYNKTDKTVITRNFDQNIINSIICYKGKIYVLGSVHVTNPSSRDLAHLWVMNQELEIIQEKDFSESGILPDKVIEHNGRIYFTSSHDVKYLLCNKVFEYSIDEDKLNTIELEQHNISDIKFYNDTLIVSHYNDSDVSFGGLTFYDNDTKEMKYYKLEHGAKEILLKGDTVYIFNPDAFYSYRIERSRIQLHVSNDFEPIDKSHFFSGFFAFEE